MCCEDMKIAQETVAIAHLDQVDTVGRIVIPRNPNRYSLSIWFGFADVVQLGMDVMPSGVFFPDSTTTQQPLVLTLKDDGDTVRRAWYARAITAPDAVYWIENVFPSDGSFCRKKEEEERMYGRK